MDFKYRLGRFGRQVNYLANAVGLVGLVVMPQDFPSGFSGLSI
jgi:hypothetical protein